MRRSILLVAGMVLVVIGCSACLPPVTYSGPKGAPRVAVVGDSITAWSSDQVESSLDAYQLTVAATPGIDLADGRRELVQPVVATKPSVLVVELGINSAREAWDSSDLPHLEGILSDTDSIACVIWVTPTALDASYYDHLGKGTLNDRIAAFKASLVKRLSKNPNVHLADWGAIQEAHADWYDTDRLHLNAKGKAAYGEYLAEQVDTLC